MTNKDILNNDIIDKIKSTQKNDTKDSKSSRFIELENSVKSLLKIKDWDRALKVLTLWALKLWTSDVHFDTTLDGCIMRFRIDWILLDITNFTKKEYQILIERIKYSSSLKINIDNLPQDWKFSINEWDHKIDIRVSTLPTNYWENVVFRILDSKKAIIDFDSLWFIWKTKEYIEKTIKKNNWLILVTWPTGSWKTTTLYTILSKLNTRDKKLVTLEDPIEYKLEWIIQSEVNEKKWYTYEVWLKALLRQDPDIIMIWEIRDYSTLNIATQASLTWHLVLSTLHTKSAWETIDRIINMWLKPYILSSSVDCIIAQRLVRKICPHCKTEVEPTLEERIIIEWLLWYDKSKKDLKKFKEKIKLYKWKWCNHCNHTGYKWRIWVYEILLLEPKIKELIREWWSSEEIIDLAQKLGMINMRDDWIFKALKWYTTITEILRVL